MYLYFVCYLLLGNILFSNIHHFIEHNHCNESSLNYHECEQCIFLENNDNLSFDISIIEFVINELAVQDEPLNFSYVINLIEDHKSRAPPIL